MDKSQWAEHLLRDEGFQAMMEELSPTGLTERPTNAINI